MAFEGLSEKLNATFKRLRGKGRLTEADVREGMREVRLALLEADVSYKVVKDFVASVTEKCIGADVLDSLTPAQQIVKIVNQELTALMGGTNARLTTASKGPTVVMMVGLQGAGKTTNGAKLAGLMRRQYGKRPLLAACDVYRPAAITQLQVVGKQLDIPVFEMGQIDPVTIAREAVRYAADHGNDIVFLDTAGRLHIDEALMDELKAVKAAVKPNEILLVVDAMTGQDAVNAAKAFDDALGIDGVLLTKLDGDARGGAALSIRAATGKPIKFVGYDRAVPPRPHGLPYPGHGRYAHVHREGGTAVRRGAGQEAGGEAAEKPADPQRLLRPAGAAAKHGRPEPDRRHAARRHGKGLRPQPDRREADGPQQGHHPQHDPQGAGEPPDPQRQPQKAHRRRLRPGGGGCQPAAEILRDAAADDQGHDQGQAPRSWRYDGRRYAQHEPDARLRPEEAAEISV
jgi:signal recognition particle GTPase